MRTPTTHLIMLRNDRLGEKIKAGEVVGIAIHEHEGLALRHESTNM